MSTLPFWWKQVGEKSLIKPAQNKCQVSFGYSLQLYLFCVHVCTYIITCTAWSSLFAHSLRTEVQHNRGRCSWPQCLKNSKWKSPQAAGGGSKKRRLQITCVRESSLLCKQVSGEKRAVNNLCGGICRNENTMKWKMGRYKAGTVSCPGDGSRAWWCIQNTG